MAIASVLVATYAVSLAAANSQGHELKVKVMTRNLYLGADLTRTFTATTLPEFIQAVTTTYAIVQSTNFPERAHALADEVASINPDIIGLQEVSLWRSQTPADFSPIPNAQDVEYDFLRILMDALAARRLHYAAVAVVTNFDAEAPRLTPTGLQDIRLTDRDVMLARSDLPAKQLAISDAKAGNFVAHLVIPTLVGPVPISRGWVSVDVTIHDRAFRVVNTHLEPLYPPVNVAQGFELLAGPANTPLPVVLIGDLNSAADGSTTATYGNLIRAGFADAWSEIRPANPGYTCCEAEDLRNPVPTLTERIDFVLFRGGFDAGNLWLFGEDPADRTPSGLWPSDHAGVAAKLSAPGQSP